MLGTNEKMTKYLSIFFIVLLACNSEPEQNGFDLFGYTIGDTIDEGISIVNVDSEWHSDGLIKEDPRSEVRLFNNHIEWILVKSLSDMEFDSLRLRIADIYSIEPKHSKDTVHSFLPFYGEEFRWYDTISGDKISLIRTYPDADEKVSRLWFDNAKVSRNYREELFGLEEEYEFSVPEELK